jgi:hypothetical protein
MEQHRGFCRAGTVHILAGSVFFPGTLGFRTGYCSGKRSEAIREMSSIVAFKLDWLDSVAIQPIRRITMNNRILIPAILAMLFGWGSAFAAEGKVTISSVTPETPYTNDKIMLNYDAVLSPEGNHLHLNVDGKRVDVIRQLKGTATVDPLPAGKHHICLAENTASHSPTGVEGCVDVTVWK